MIKKVAVRNIKMCTKDCLCLYVCPYGATDTEDSIIDIEKCDGCGLCADACPSKAISMVPVSYPPQQKKKDEVIDVLNKLSKSKTRQEKIALQIAEKEEKPGLKKLLLAISRSNRIIAEDIIRESGYMLPQSKNTNKLLKSLLDYEGIPKDSINFLLENIKTNE